MEPHPFSFAATIIESWFKGKKHLLTLPNKILKKSQNLITEHQCCLIQIPYIHPLMRKLAFPLPSLSLKKKTPHTFQVDIAPVVSVSMSSSEKEKQRPPVSNHEINQPLKEHLLAAKQLEQVSTQALSGKQRKHHTVSLFVEEIPQETPRDPSPYDWVFQKKEERQLQIDRAIRYPHT